ncbi:MAG: glycosyltransferase family 2 protein [Candidatus Hodarchaeota archaeon]
MSKDITICMVHHNDSDFLINTLYCLKKITKNNYKVIIRDNNSTIEEYLKLKKKINEYPNVKLYRVNNFNYTTSMAHGIALNELVTRIDTKFGVIMDPDFTFLHKHWDEILISKLNEKCPIIGTQAPLRPGPLQQPRDFPIVHGILFDNEIIKKFKIDFRPDFNANEEVTINDTGYQLREKLHKNGFYGKILDFRNRFYYKLRYFKNIDCSEFYLKGYRHIFGSHLICGGLYGNYEYIHYKYMKYSWRIIFSNIKEWRTVLYVTPIVGKYFIKFQAKRDKKKWLKICRNIVDNINE